MNLTDPSRNAAFTPPGGFELALRLQMYLLAPASLKKQAFGFGVMLGLPPPPSLVFWLTQARPLVLEPIVVADLQALTIFAGGCADLPERLSVKICHFPFELPLSFLPRTNSLK